MKRSIAGMLAVCAATLVVAAPAAAIDKVVTIDSDGPGPEAYDHVYVHQMGPKKAAQSANCGARSSGTSGRSAW